MATKLGDVLVVFGFVILSYGICGVLISPGWLIKVPRHIPIFVGSFLKLPKCSLNIDLVTSCLCRNALNKKKKMAHL